MHRKILRVCRNVRLGMFVCSHSKGGTALQVTWAKKRDGTTRFIPNVSWMKITKMGSLTAHVALLTGVDNIFTSLIILTWLHSSQPIRIYLSSLCCVAPWTKNSVLKVSASSGLFLFFVRLSAVPPSPSRINCATSSDISTNIRPIVSQLAWSHLFRRRNIRTFFIYIYTS